MKKKGFVSGALMALALVWLAMPGRHRPDPGLARFAGIAAAGGEHADWIAVNLSEVALADGVPAASLEQEDQRIRELSGVDLSRTRRAGRGPSLPAGPLPRPLPPPRDDSGQARQAPFGSALFSDPAQPEQGEPLFRNSGWLAADVQALQSTPESEPLRPDRMFDQERDAWDRIIDPFSNADSESLLGSEQGSSDPFRESETASPWGFERGAERNESPRRLGDDWLR